MCDVSQLPTITCQLTDLSVDSADSPSHVTVGMDVALKDAGLLTLILEAKVSTNEYPVHIDKERTKIFIDPEYKVALVLVIDDTGSMQAEINNVKKTLIEFIDAINPSDAPLSVLLTFGDEVKYRAVTQDMTVLRDAIGNLPLVAVLAQKHHLKQLALPFLMSKKTGKLYFLRMPRRGWYD